MQIKRFEAEDMTEALRMVKREFGDDAVILSAKEIRAGGFFSALRKKSVEITAATDYPADDGSGPDADGVDDFPGMLSQHLEDEPETDRVTLSITPQSIKPFSPNVPSSDHHSPRSEPSVVRTDRSDTPLAKGPIADGLNPALERPACPVEDEGPVAEWVRYMANHDLIAEPFYSDGTQPKTIAVVGPCGAGKSTMVAKLAWHCRTIEKKRIGLISSDRFRISANAMLERVAQIMNLPLTIVHDAEQMQSTLNDLEDVDVVLIDTPGISRMDALMKDDLFSLIRIANPDETHLVANATVRDDVFAATVNAFSPFGVDRLICTHMDEYIGSPSMLNLLNKVRLPVSFFADGVDLSDGLKEAAAVRLAGWTPRLMPSEGQLTSFTGKRKQMETGSTVSGDYVDSSQYVANRNSELFHHANCKSVKRINAKNIIAFNSIQEAMDEGFKPCRACCNDSMISKPAPATFGYQHVSAI